MGKTYASITAELAAWLGRQHLFFVATAPLAANGHVNCSPKGMDSFRVLDPRTVGYQDLTGSGIETAAHIRENGRIVLMFCAFQGPPKIVRLYGHGDVIEPDHTEFAGMASNFPPQPAMRALIRVSVERIADSCGYAVPRYEFVKPRDTLERWAEAKGADGLAAYRRQKNARSIDGLPGLKHFG